ncbi:bifunctional phosphoribosyl-AMP cyclohydrolase/phosphoribosyl-ATP diphosphatase HisIE [Sphingomonas astaxanthinifaciens]|uniref:Histidine biosynthesis bifunctional protein HisIE n=1 Tax=Sphingomonas astaxanthinifaciens DSM 22298 TaxID=1123267 RepID=A0ABQ5Z5D9_9SPHN|nr:bifunctional phosphoribosyl-AMP cyclohydrolase/phosphoribosyl-ATP diphosphatase HisIE [Sphingomonas astaxanthinifaciens]GLR47980.1 histidine biosynthesis bifunctional protein HisIE [Sphingomonas astaxanthinifaciens DSM 22298]
MTLSIDSLAWDKMDGLLPAIVQDPATGQVLMLGYMDRAALAATLDSGLVTFFSRSKNRLWRKGETSGNVLKLVAVRADCDSDALLVSAQPQGPTCHTGTDSCFGTEPEGAGWLAALERIVATRAAASPQDSYTARLLADGPAKAAQKVGEEGVEVALAAVSRDPEGLTEEAADLLFHLLVTLRSRDVPLASVIERLALRHKSMRTGEEQSA